MSVTSHGAHYQHIQWAEQHGTDSNPHNIADNPWQQIMKLNHAVIIIVINSNNTSGHSTSPPRLGHNVLTNRSNHVTCGLQVRFLFLLLSSSLSLFLLSLSLSLSLSSAFLLSLSLSLSLCFPLSLLSSSLSLSLSPSSSQGDPTPLTGC